ncbi:MAG: hypothetical protein HRU03_05945, partial [Nanoarchaeales archaeon]|nr:hypothetical protein [Nanoarchaeales archaeon]
MYYNFSHSLSETDLNVLKRDTNYRFDYISKYYTNLERTDANDFLFFFCSYYNIYKLGNQIKDIFDSNVFDFKNMNYCQ